MVPLFWNGPVVYKRNVKESSSLVPNCLVLCFANDTKLFASFLPNPVSFLPISSLTPITVLNQTGTSDRKKRDYLVLDSEASGIVDCFW